LPVNDLSEIKEELRDLVFSGQKDKAILLLQEKYDVSPAEAEKLLVLALRESLNPARLIRSVFGRAIGYKKGFFRILAFVMGFIGIPILLAAIGVFVYTNYQIEHSEKVIGTVVELEPHVAYDEATTYTPIIAYDMNGEEHSLAAPVYSDTPEFSVGDTLVLYVNREDPKSVIIDTFTQRWLMIVVTGMIGFSFTCSMIVLIYQRKRS